jgi:hypothetical protein
MESRYLLYYGRPEPLPQPLPLRAGPLTLLYDNGDLRCIRLGGKTLLLRLYAAVRDQHWATVPGQLQMIEQTIRPDSFHLLYQSEHRQAEIHFVWRGEITGSSQGVITFTMDGEARTSFARNRIGFCMLHPASCAGLPCQVEHVDGTRSAAPLPEWIVPDQPVEPFSEMRALTMEMESGLRVRLQMEGDIFEMEDQRNWTDASYKTFCTPLRLPYPVVIPAGTRIQQKITLSLENRPDAPDAAAPSPSAPHLALNYGAQMHPLPAVGLGLAESEATLSPEQTGLLRRLSPAHLRVELRLSDSRWRETLRAGIAQGSAIGVPLEMALLLPAEPETALDTLRIALEERRPQIVRWLVLPERERMREAPDHTRLLRAARAALPQLAARAEFAAGSNSDFLFANRFPPPAEADALTFAINPQVHAFDNASLLETLEAQGVVIRSARRLADGRPVIVSPVTLLPCHNPYAAVPLPWSPPPADYRQPTLFGAVWTLGCLKYLSESGASSVTLFETVGDGGVLRGSEAFPLYHVIADVTEFAGGEVVIVGSSDPLTVIGMAFRRERRLRLLLANLTMQAQTLTVSGLPPQMAQRVLDETTAQEAIHAPEAFRARAAETVSTDNGLLALTLAPLATARLDSL